MNRLKSAHDIAMIRESGKVLAECLLMLDDVIKEGISTWDINRIAHEFITSKGCYPSCLGYCGYKYATCTSVNDTVIHGLPNKKEILKDGDIISVDICVTREGYISDSTRTYEVGKVSSDVHKLNLVTRECLYLGIDAARKKNARMSDVSSAVYRHATENGYGVVRDYTGHGVGFDLHEDPEVPNFTSPVMPNPRLKPGMVIAIEPMINMGTWRIRDLRDGWTVKTADGSPACHWEHTIAITDNGVEILTEI